MGSSCLRWPRHFDSRACHRSVVPFIAFSRTALNIDDISLAGASPAWHKNARRDRARARKHLVSLDSSVWTDRSQRAFEVLDQHHGSRPPSRTMAWKQKGDWGAGEWVCSACGRYQPWSKTCMGQECKNKWTKEQSQVSRQAMPMMGPVLPVGQVVLNTPPWQQQQQQVPQQMAGLLPQQMAGMLPQQQQQQQQAPQQQWPQAPWTWTPQGAWPPAPHPGLRSQPPAPADARGRGLERSQERAKGNGKGKERSESRGKALSNVQASLQALSKEDVSGNLRADLTAMKEKLMQAALDDTPLPLRETQLKEAIVRWGAREQEAK